jgi:hypothetical protein
VGVVGLILHKIKYGLSESRRFLTDTTVRDALNYYLFSDLSSENINNDQRLQQLGLLLNELCDDLQIRRTHTWSHRRRSLKQVALLLSTEVIGETRTRLTFLFEHLGFVDEAMNDMADTRWWIRAQGCRDAGFMASDRALFMLELRIDDPNEDVRIEAAQSIIDIGGVNALSGIILRLKELSLWMKTRLSRSILSFGGDAVPHLALGIRSKHPQVQGFCIELLGLLGDVSALQVLLEYIRSETPDVQQKSLIAFGKIGDSRAIPVIQQFLQSENRDLRYAATRAAVNLASPELALQLHNHLLKEDMEIKLAAAEALSRSGDTGIKSLLYASRISDERVRLIAHQFLHDLGIAVPQGGEMP